MWFRAALLRAAARRNDLNAEQRKALRQVILWPRRRVDDKIVQLDELVEAEAIDLGLRSEPALFVAALANGMDLAGAQAVGAGGLVGAIDWGKLLDWLVANLPKIIEIIMTLIALF